MAGEKQDNAAIIYRAKIEALLKDRSEALSKSEGQLNQLQSATSKMSEQVVGLRHRVNELQELLK